MKWQLLGHAERALQHVVENIKRFTWEWDKESQPGDARITGVFADIAEKALFRMRRVLKPITERKEELDDFVEFRNAACAIVSAFGAGVLDTLRKSKGAASQSKTEHEQAQRGAALAAQELEAKATTRLERLKLLRGELVTEMEELKERLLTISPEEHGPA